MAMRLLLLTITMLLSALRPAHAIDITQCSMVARGESVVIPFAVRLDDGRDVTLSGILTKPSGSGPFPVILMLPGGGGLYTPYCYAAVVERFAEWGFATVIIASTTAKDSGGKTLFEYSFVDQANHARGTRAMLNEIDGIDLDRVAVWGFSRGGMAALYLAASPTTKTDGFKAIIAAAPHCPSKVVMPHAPLLLVIGGEDKSVSVEICREYAARLMEARSFEFLLLPGAPHVFWQHPATATLSDSSIKSFLSNALQ
ncbi:MAG: dienelactone hydrolase family protein [Pseudomonadota bacterium]